MTARRPLRLLAVALVGVLGPAAGARAATCPEEPLLQPFSSWGDPAYYVSVPGGQFDRTLDWAVTGTATLVEDGNPFTLLGDQTSARVDADGTITSPVFCISKDRPNLRFAAHALDRQSTLLTQAVFTGDDGRPKTVNLRSDNGDRFSAWALTGEVKLGGLIPPGERTRAVQLRFVVRNGLGFVVDSVWVDPIKRG